VRSVSTSLENAQAWLCAREKGFGIGEEQKMSSIRFRLLGLLAVICLIFLLGVSAQAQAPAGQCSPALPVLNASGCGVLITITGTAAAPVATITLPGNGNPYDGDEDVLVGVQNNSTATISGLNLSSSGNPGAFNFDQDGPCHYNGADCFQGATGYEGPTTTFSQISGNKASGAVNFTTPLAPGGSTWFALENNPTSAVVQDQCSGALPVGNATGCGALITINPGTAGATTAVITFPGNGNPYDGDEDILVGIQNNSTVAVSSITLTSNGNPFSFAFDHDGPCSLNSMDCFEQATGYEGPDNTFGGISANFSTGTVNFVSPIAPGQSTWFALENNPQSVTAVALSGTTIDTTNPQTLAQSFIFNNAPDAQVEFDFNYNIANGSQDLTVNTGTVPTVTNLGINQFTYHQMVAGTSLATTNCYTAPGEGTDQGGNALCAQQTLTCISQGNSTPAGDNCPQSTERNDFWAQIVQTPDAINVNPGVTAPTLAMGSDNWTPASCVLIGPETGALCPQSELTQFLLLASDPLPKSGGTGKTSNSTYIAACCAPTWHTTANVPLWNRTTTVGFTLTSAPPSAPPLPNNNWVAASNKSVTFGWEGFGQAPDPTFPVPNDVTVTNQQACPQAWPAPGTVPPSATNTGSVMVPGEGKFELHFFSTGCDNQAELFFTPQPVGTNWAAFRTAPFNVDQTAPQVSGLSLSVAPLNGTYFVGQPVKASLTCTDPVSGGVASGIATCGPGVTSFNGQNPVTVTNAIVPTSVAGGPFTFGATDLAGNSATAFTYSVVPYSPADVDVIEVGPLTIKSGSTATFIIGAWNEGPSTAYNVVVSSTLPAGESLISANYALVTCSFSGCTAPPPGASSCTPSAGGFTCSVPALPAIVKGSKSFTGIGVKVVTRVTAGSGTTIKNTAIVNASNPNTDTDNTFTWPTKVY
jgi:uncharacterized repeat protein (TIGR01451 family)